MDNGTFKARATECALGETGTGKEQIAIDFEITDERAAGEHITWYGYFTDKSLEITIRALRACGWIGDDLSDLNGIGSKEVSIVIETEADDQGLPRKRVKWVNAPGGLAMKTQLSPVKAKTFAAAMRAKIAMLEGPRAANGSKLPKPENDIPF